jgi:CubicO group peptidase (beta-lactamase class C family)
MEARAVMNAVDWSKVETALAQASVPFAPPPSSRDSSDKEQARSGKLPQHAFPGGVLLVGLGGEVVFHQAFGCRSLKPESSPMHEDTVFDVASLTKVVVTTTLVMQLVDKGLLDVDRRLSHIFQTFGIYGKERMTIRHLLTHTSGYPATAPYYKQIARADRAERAGMMTSRGAVESVYNEFFRAKIDHLPGKVTKYSDIGFILLGNAVEVVSGTSLDKLARQQVFRPLGMANSGYIDLTTLKRRGLQPVTDAIAPTAQCSWRGRMLCGEVHDDNAWAMGGVAAHAGLFTNAIDLHLFASELIRCFKGQSDFISKETLRQFWCRDQTDPQSSWALGWDTPSGSDSAAGRLMSRHSVGHLGYTGCSLWIDPEAELDVILLTNRIHSATDSRSIQSVRPLIHDLVVEALGVF